MSRNSWLDRLLRSGQEPRTRQKAELSVRALENRRVLDGTMPAILVTPTPATEGSTVTVSADTGEVVQPEFDWTVAVDEVVIATSNDQLFEFTPADNGAYTINLVITGNDGGQWTSSRTFAVANVRPELTVTGPQQATEGTPVVIENLGQIADPGFADPTRGTQETFSYTIDWGDGLIQVATATIDQVGSPGVPTLASFDGQHVYADDGQYTVRVSVLDDDGGRASSSFELTVGNAPPTLTLVGNQTINQGQLLSLVDLGKITDSGFSRPASGTSETFSYTIDWGDGSAAITGTATIDQVGSATMLTRASFDGSHLYSSSGTYTVKVQVADDDGGMAMGQFQVRVVNAAPRLTVVGNQRVDEGSLLLITDLGQVSDPVFSPAMGDQITYTINWGDGTVSDSGTATIDDLGSQGFPTLASFDGSHTYADNGVYTVTVSIDDGDGGSDAKTFRVTVGNVAPTLTVPEDQMVEEGQLLSLTNLGQISDPGFRNAALATDETFTYSIDWGDGSMADTGTATIDRIGAAGVLTLASFDGAHTYADNGTYTVTVTVKDDDGGTVGKTFDVKVGNVSPTLTVPGNQTVAEGTLLSIENIGQVSDANFAPGSASNPAFSYSIDWGDGSAPITGMATIDQVGGDGVPTLASFDGSHTYADNGTYTVTVTVEDVDGGMDLKSFDVVVGNVAPTLSVVPDQTVDEGTLLSITNLGQITDPAFAFEPLGNIKAFDYTIDWGDGIPLDTGSATIDQNGSPGTPTLASFDGAHTYADNGTYTVIVKVMDDDGAMDSKTFDVVVGNVAPTLTVVPNQTIDEGALLSITNIGQISDPGFRNDALATDETFSYSIDWGDGSAVDTGSATIDQLGAPGTPTLASFDGAHTYADNGTYTVTVEVMDDDGGMATQTFDVVAGNVAPTLTVVPNQAIDEGALLSITNLGQITDPAFAFEPLGNVKAFDYTIDWGDGTPLDTGDATIDQNGSPGTPTTASFDGAHTYADNGTYTVTVKVMDDDGAMDTKTFDVVVGNVAPTLTVVPNQAIDEGTLLSITNLGRISDPGFRNDALATDETFSYSIDWGDGSAADTGNATIDQVGSPGKPTLASFDGSHTYADNGTYTVTVKVMDDDGGMAAQTFDVVVGNVAPTLTVVPDQTVDEGVLLSITNLGQISDPAFAFEPLGNVKAFDYTIDWGDGTPLDTGDATIDQNGSPGTPTTASFDGGHTYADNGTYTVTVKVMDDDGAMDTKTFDVVVGNVAPTLTVVPNQAIDEGTLLSITNLGQITDPGFRNDALTTDETFSYSIDWGDGSAVDSGSATIDTVGSPGVATAASLDASHTFADNGTYTVTVSVMDDDGGMDTKTFSVLVSNVAPTLTVAANQTVDEGQLLSLTNIGRIADPGFDNTALSTRETFTYSVDWGEDPTAVPTVLSATIDRVGSPGVTTLASFDASHTYADNGVFTVTVTATDDDGGSDQQQFTVTVNNVAPQLTGVGSPFELDEGQEFSLEGLNVGLSDPGFDLESDNPATPAENFLSRETFTASSIDWGDGTVTTPVSVVMRNSGSPGQLTTARFQHDDHAYADNGTYTVTVEFTDDDGGAISQSFTIVVNNVAPTLTLTDRSITINEGDTLDLFDLGTFEDPGYNNPNRPGGPSQEMFTYEITWDDGTVIETGKLPASLANGAQGVTTKGTLTDIHFYADNDVDNTYTITVKLSDDDGGFDVQSFDITVLNVAPTLQPIAALDINSAGNTVLTLTFSDPGADSFEVLVAWGENQQTPLEDRWVVETVHAGPTPETFVLFHQYAGPPNPENISADIPISVVIRDDDFASATTVALGQSNIQTVLVGQPGTEGNNFAIDLRPEIPTIEFSRAEREVMVAETASNAVVRSETTNIDSGGGEAAASTERFFRLNVVLPDGRMLEGIRLPDDAINDLPALFARLPDNHYRIYLVHNDTQTERLVLDVVVRNGRPVDPGDASDGTRDRPPTSDPSAEEPGAPDAVDAEPALEAIPQANAEPLGRPAVGSRGARRAAAASALAAAALVVDPKTDWAVRLDAAFARADRRRWQQLRRRRPK